MTTGEQHKLSFLPTKSKLKENLLSFLLILKITLIRVKIFRSDNETEILQEKFGKILGEKGISNQRSIVWVPQQNGRVERKHIFYLETTIALKIHAGF